MRGPMSSSSAAISHSSGSGCKTASTSYCSRQHRQRIHNTAAHAIQAAHVRMAAHRLQAHERLGGRRLRLRRRACRMLLRRVRVRAADTPGKLACSNPGCCFPEKSHSTAPGAKAKTETRAHLAAEAAAGADVHRRAEFLARAWLTKL
jgi:hypothetical protein